MKRMWSKNELKNLTQEQISSGQLKNVKIFENIVDAQGNKRFIEGDISLLETAEEGIAKTYGKWSLSGTHLLIVLGLSLPNTLEIVSGRKAILTLPKWVYDKIVVLFSASIVDYKGYVAYADDYSTQNVNVYLQKYTDNALTMYFNGLTLTADRKVRIAFDLLIDDEAPVTP